MGSRCSRSPLCDFGYEAPKSLGRPCSVRVEVNTRLPCIGLTTVRIRESVHIRYGQGALVTPVPPITSGPPWRGPEGRWPINGLHNVTLFYLTDPSLDLHSYLLLSFALLLGFHTKIKAIWSFVVVLLLRSRAQYTSSLSSYPSTLPNGP